MRIVDIIEKKKQGECLTQKEIAWCMEKYMAKEVKDYQMSALLMAICFQGMSQEETIWLCEAMLNSGDRMDLSMITGRKADKHSTGGVGDKTSLTLAPMVAACGLKIAKMSGRGLGHTGGTLDKMESIKGFQVQISEEQFLKQLEAIGIVLAGQTKDLVPADKELYALRDVTATVNSIPLIASSIMSKKLACGADTILLDVKYGEGAFMRTKEEARELAKCMIEIGKYFGKDTKALLSDMNVPLGNAIGNALEVKEAIATLQGKGPKDFYDLCMEAGVIMLLQNHCAENAEKAKAMLEDAIQSGRAFDKLCQLVSWQHGEVEQLYHPELLPSAAYITAIPAKQDGYIQTLHALQLGKLAMQLGAGRETKEQDIDPAVGIVLCYKQGNLVHKDDILAYVHSNQPLTKQWLQDFEDAYVFTDKQTKEDTTSTFEILS